MDSQVAYLLSPQAVRERSRQIFDFTVSGEGCFSYHPEKWDEVTEFVHATILDKYPSLEIPFHSRLGHFRAGGVDRLLWNELNPMGVSLTERARMLIDLVVPSVLLDAGAGPQWSFAELKTGQRFTRSEGLGVASLYLFLDKKMSSSGGLQTDALALTKLQESDLLRYFQVTDKNPLVGVEGRLYLLRQLGVTMLQNPSQFPTGRPSDLLNRFIKNNKVDAAEVLNAVLLCFGSIWPSRLTWNGVPLGDTWSHPKLGSQGSFESLVPFHKLSQWLSYSLLDACQLGGFELEGVESLTGLPEYRNGGLFLDLGLIQLKDRGFESCGLTPEMPITIEWRALTVTLLDGLAERIQNKLCLSPRELPLAKVLEGGSWWAGRKIASIKRADGGPPVKIISDGTVF